MFSLRAAVAALKAACRLASTLMFMRLTLCSANPLTSCPGPVARAEMSIAGYEYHRIRHCGATGRRGP